MSRASDLLYINLGKMGREPMPALAQSLRVRNNLLNILHPTTARQQVMMNVQENFRGNPQVRLHQQIQRLPHHAFR